MAVKVEHLWKTFQIPHERRTTLFENLVGMMKPKQYETFYSIEGCQLRGGCRANAWA